MTKLTKPMGRYMAAKIIDEMLYGASCGDQTWYIYKERIEAMRRALNRVKWNGY